MKILPTPSLKSDHMNRPPFLRLDIGDDYDADDNSYDYSLNDIVFDFVYPDTYDHIDGYNLFEISSYGLFLHTGIGYNDNYLNVDIDRHRSLKTVGVDIV